MHTIKETLSAGSIRARTGDSSSGSSHHHSPKVARSAAVVSEPIEGILGIPNALARAEDMRENNGDAASNIDMDGEVAPENGGGGGSEVARLVDKQPFEGGGAQLCVTASAVDRDVGQPAVQYANNPYWPPPGAMDLTS